VEGRSLSAVAHLALLGVNYAGNGILGLRKIKAARNRCFLSWYRRLGGSGDMKILLRFVLDFFILGKCDMVYREYVKFCEGEE